jgi:hypothetical protein
MTKKDWAKVVKKFKAQCASTIASFIIKLEKKFSTQELLSFINVIFPPILISFKGKGCKF